MAGNTQMNEDERGILSFHGLTGGIIATVLLLTILGVLSFYAISVQQNEATNFYQINQDLDALKMVSPDNHKHYELVGNK